MYIYTIKTYHTFKGDPTPMGISGLHASLAEAPDRELRFDTAEPRDVLRRGDAGDLRRAGEGLECLGTDKRCRDSLAIDI